MRRAAKIDSNQKEIVKVMRQMGASVLHLHGVGKGCPDALVGRAGKNLLVEIKDGSLAPSKQRLTPDEQRFHDTWAGQVAVITSVKEAVDLVLSLTGKQTRRDNGICNDPTVPLDQW